MMVSRIASSGVPPIRTMVTSLLCSAALAVGLVSFEAKADETVVFAGWGGSIQKAERDIIFDAFEKETGIKVIDVPDVNFAKIKAMVESGDVQWDVVQTLGMWIPQGDKENLWEKLDFDVIDASGVPDAMKTPTGIGQSAYGMVLAYNTEAFPEGKEPTSWADYWNVEDFPARRGIHDAARYSLETALMADGVPMDEIYPIDVDRAFASLDRVKDDIDVWWKKWPQVPILLASREIEMSLISHTRILDIQEKENAPVAIQWNQSLMTVDFVAVPRGAKNKENAMKLINWMTKADLQAELARQTGIGPSNSNAFDLLSAEDNDRLPSYHYKIGDTLAFDNAWWAENQEAVAERWNVWKLK